MTKLVSMIILILVSGIAVVTAEIPQVINYQGMITDNGNPVADGSYNMRFRIFDAVTGGNLEWDSGTISVSLSAGIFSVPLGESPQPTIGLDFNEDYWLLTTFSGTNQTPRQRLGAVGYSYMASGLVPGTEISGEVITGTDAAIKAHNTATSGINYGVYGQSNSFSGRGLYGIATASAGLTIGVFGESSSTNGKGVFANAASTSGSTYGVYSLCYSPNGYGVYTQAPSTGVFGLASATTGQTAGVYGQTASTAGYGVHGYALNAEGSPYGVYGHAASTDGKGVVGVNSSTEGYADGIMGQSSSRFGKGVQGYNYSNTGTAIAVGGQTHSTQGRAVYGYAQATEGFNFGVYGLSNSTQGKGVFGLASGTAGYCYGVYGESFSTGGAAGVFGEAPEKGVEGEASQTTGATYGGVFGNWADSGGGVSGTAWRSSTGNAMGVRGMTYSENGCGAYGFHSDSGNEGFLATKNAGVYGLSSMTTGYGIHGENDGGGLAGKFEGDVDVNGRLELPDNDATPTAGTGALQIGDVSRALKLDGNEIITNTGEVLHIQRDNNGDLQVDNGTLTVDASLNRVGIGTSAPDEALTVYGRVYVSNMDGTSDGYTVRWYDNRLYYLVSSEKYKASIQTLDDDFETILEAVPRSFTDKASGNTCIGFIAEELDHLGLEHLVQYQNDEPQAVKYEMISLYLLEVIKDLKRENEDFAARLAVLEAE